MPEESSPKDKLKRIRKQSLYLMPEKTIFWKEKDTLLVADIHIGKDSAFRKAGIAVPEAVTDSDLVKLSSAIERTNSKRLIFLGDFQHSKSGNTKKTIEKVAQWRASLGKIEVILVLGNHDLASGLVPNCWNFKTIKDKLVDGPFTFKHHPDPEKGTYTLSGHVHPSIRLYGKGKQTEKLPCFYFKKDLAILPAFGSFTGTFSIDPQENSQIFMVLEDSVIKYQSNS